MVKNCCSNFKVIHFGRNIRHQKEMCGINRAHWIPRNKVCVGAVSTAGLRGLKGTGSGNQAIKHNFAKSVSVKLQIILKLTFN